MNKYEEAIFEKCRMCATDEGFELCTYDSCPLYKFRLFPGRHENELKAD